MQPKDEKIQKLIKTFGELIREKRKASHCSAMRLFSYSYDLERGTLSRIENGLVETRWTMLWRIAEALEIPLSELIKILEDRLGEDFSLIDK